jgi:hypothetical protein
MRNAIGIRLDRFYHGVELPTTNEQAELFSVSPGFAMNYSIALKLVDVYEAHGTDGVAALLNAMQAEATTLKVAVASEVVAWIDAWVVENLADV